MPNQYGDGVAHHPQYKQIIDDIIAGKTVREIAARTKPPVSVATIHRLRKERVFPAIKQAAAATELMKAAGQTVEPYETAVTIARQAVSADYFFERIEKKYSRYDRNIAKAEQNEDFKSVAALDNAETRTLQLHAELAGLMKSDVQNTTNIQVVIMPSQPQAIEEAEVIDVSPLS